MSNEKNDIFTRAKSALHNTEIDSALQRNVDAKSVFAGARLL
jgi:hypothetical protein